MKSTTIFFFVFVFFLASATVPAGLQSYGVSRSGVSQVPLSSPQAVNLSLSSGQELKVLAQSSSSIIVLSVSGGHYNMQLQSLGTQNELLFTPLDNSNYSITLNVTSSGPNYALISRMDAMSPTWEKNLTGTGNIVLNISMSASRVSAEKSIWNPLFGFTGISAGGISLNSTDILIVFTTFSLVLLGLGAKFNQKLLYFGLFLLSIIGSIMVGILVIAVIIGGYLACFLLTKSYFDFRARKTGSRGQR